MKPGTYTSLSISEPTASAYRSPRDPLGGLPVLMVGALAMWGGTSSAEPPTRRWENRWVREAGTSTSRKNWDDLAFEVTELGSETTRKAVSELRRLSGLTWDQLGMLFGVSRRSVHYWASGQALSRTNETRLLKILDVVRFAYRGESRQTRLALSAAHDGTTALDLLAAEKFEDARALLGEGSDWRRPVFGELSPEAKAERSPLPPEELVSALHDRVHRDPGGARVARTVRNAQRGTR